ncbi:pyruvate formate-lyase-activating protein [Peptostreptococcus faecalis]|uniref:pyruvate formate-lyase-activating protein n=1 Tax=Peptostreptococcus faecalis TaxID=2045015 RepID=UPI000C7B46CC|nr:pyruvate formate-lyase-activating protein [Peptostreptococcus faecalis]
MVKGRIHSIETFGTVDGPGIRYIVFTQGCPLRCRYCHNRDTWDPNLGKETTAEEIIEDALKYKTFFDSSGGGITISGGEATSQPEFIEDVFRLAKENNLHTCLDTNGIVDIQKIMGVLKYMDLILLDIKHMNPEKSRWLTGVSSEKAIKLAKDLDKLDIPVWIRHVLIPGISDDRENLIKLAELIKSLSNVQKFEFLPYHTMGKQKWLDLGKEYTLEDVPDATDEDVAKAKSIFSEVGVYI